MNKYNSLTIAERHDCVCKAYDLAVGFRKIANAAGIIAANSLHFAEDEEKNTVSFDCYLNSYEWVSLGTGASIWDTDEVMAAYSRAVANVCGYLTEELKKARAAIAPEVSDTVSDTEVEKAA